MQTDTAIQKNKVDWAALLADAIAEPGMISEAYSLFHEYSIGNSFWALSQCRNRKLIPGPLASFNRWKELGRNVKKGEKALSLYMPVSGKREKTDSSTGEVTADSYQFFMLRNNWFVLTQTDGAEYTPEPIPDWDEAAALTALEVTKIDFDSIAGNVQGFAQPGRRIAVSPIASHPHKTLFHELAHVMLPGHLEADALSDDEKIQKNVKEMEAEAVAMLCCASLGLPGVEYSRGYIQHYAAGETISAVSARRIFTATEKILKAGTRK